MAGSAWNYHTVSLQCLGAWAWAVFIASHFYAVLPYRASTNAQRMGAALQVSYFPTYIRGIESIRKHCEEACMWARVRS